MFNNKIILVTGGTGSFGSAFVDYLIKKKINFKEIRIFSRDEKKQDDFRKKIKISKVKFFIGDVKDIDSVDAAMKNVDFVFHAAAYKQVPSCEFYPIEAVKTNILGTENILRKAIDNKVKKVICLSTDKAVYPINAMGISKAMMEKIAISKSLLSKNLTSICITRYGNVMASRGSVIPLFVDQIKNNKPITVTNLKMTRFLMSMEKALELVFYALKNGKNGGIYVQKTKSTTILNIVNALKRIFKKPNHPIKIIGYRHGEKEYESLLTREESSKAIDHGKYFYVPADNRDLNYDLFYRIGNKKTSRYSDYNSNNVEILSVKEVEKTLRALDLIK
jgi:UDP-N-acetylglucosamine 4,6-dehydratase